MNKHLEEVIERFGNLKTEADSYKKQIEADNTEIKKLMKEGQLTEAVSGPYKVVYSEATSESFDDEKLIAKVRELWLNSNGTGNCPYVKTVVVPDMKAIEDAIYHGEINPSDLVDCKTVKKTPRLNLYKIC